jgi:thioredoxin 1
MNITIGNFDSVLEQSFQKPVLLDFWASWCGPCRMLAPVIEELEGEVGEKVIIGKVNVDEQVELAQSFNVSSIPTIVVIKDKNIVSRSVGYKNLNQLKSMLGIE